jgi:RNA polymerase sigma-70 factor, ECF subfamily
VPATPSLDAPEDDLALVRRVRAGDQDAARLLFDRYYDRIYNYVHARLGRVADAEDVAIEAMTRTLTRLNTFQDQGIAFSAWIYRIAHNATIDHYRRHGKTQTVPLDEAQLPQGDDPSELALDRLRNENLREAIRTLTEEQQQVLILRFFQDLSAVQVAEVVGKSVGAVQALQHRALGALERTLTLRRAI